MAHNASCANARKPGCKCPCGGARHGCQGAFRLADGALQDVLSYREERERDWDKRPDKLTIAQAAIGCAQADVVHWLHRDHELLACARKAQAMAFEDAPDTPAHGRVLREVAAHLGPRRMDEFQTWARKTHFWCELLAQIAAALARYEEMRGRIFRAVEAALLQKRYEEPLPSELLRAGVVESAVGWAWRHVLASIVAASGGGSLAALLAGGDVQRLLWPVRVIAVLMCPDAANHRAVREHCWDPIVRHAKADVRDVVRDRLTQTFPKDPWFV